MENIKSVFLKAYANLPLALRQEIIVVLDGEPLTWNAVKLEVENNTKKGDDALKILQDLGILKVENVRDVQSKSTSL